jgi:hypothetical protein
MVVNNLVIPAEHSCLTTIINCNLMMNIWSTKHCMNPDSCVLCAQCCQFLWIVHSLLPIRFISNVSFLDYNC